MSAAATLTPPPGPKATRPRDAAAPAETARRRTPSRIGDPTWEVAEWLYPRQGRWTREAVDEVAPAVPHPFSFDPRAGTLDFGQDGLSRFSPDLTRKSLRGEPTWELAELLHPRQGEWTEEQYIEVAGLIDRRVEFVRGFLDFHGMADWTHALICRWLVSWLDREAGPAGGGMTMFASLTVRVVPGELNREPDVFLLKPGVRRDGRRYPTAEDVLTAFEVVSPDSRDVRRDRVEKRTDYAAAGIREYWIVDPRHPGGPHVLVLTLPDGATEYAEHGTFRPGDAATSPALPGLTCDVAALFAAAEG